jgi:hypothetical protein
MPPMHVYEARPRKDHRGFDLISDALPFGLWYGRQTTQTRNVYDAAGNMIGTHKRKRNFKASSKFWSRC